MPPRLKGYARSSAWEVVLVSDSVPVGTGEGQEAREVEYEIGFTLAAGYDEQDAIELYEYIERHKAVDGAVLSGRFGERVAPYDQRMALRRQMAT